MDERWLTSAQKTQKYLHQRKTLPTVGDDSRQLNPWSFLPNIQIISTEENLPLQQLLTVFYNFGEEPCEFCNFLSLRFINILNPVSYRLPCRSGYFNPEEETTISQGIHISPVWIILDYQGIVRKYLLQIV